MQGGERERCLTDSENDVLSHVKILSLLFLFLSLQSLKVQLKTPLESYSINNLFFFFYLGMAPSVL